MKTSSLPKLEAHHRNPDCITSTWGLPKKREVYDILPLPEQLWSSSEQMFSFRFQNSQLSVYILCHDLTKAQFSCTSMRNEIVMPARIILQADILNFPFLCYSWENKALNYEETVIFNFKFFSIIPFLRCPRYWDKKDNWSIHSLYCPMKTKLIQSHIGSSTDAWKMRSFRNLSHTKLQPGLHLHPYSLY